MKVFKRPRKPTAEKSTSENPHRKRPIFVMEKYGIQSTSEMAFKRTVTLRASFRFPPSALMRPRYCRSADALRRMQNALLFMADYKPSHKNISFNILCLSVETEVPELVGH